jgi:hypothetical protein
MNLLSFAAAGMVPAIGGNGGNGNGKPPPDSADITILVDADTGKPKAEPDSAWVAPGGKIVWTSPVAFEIILKLMWSGERISRKSKKVAPDGPDVVEVTAGSINGRYSYGIAIDGEEVDPDVVIGPKSH